MTTKHRTWTDDEIAILRDRYPHEPTATVARDLDRPIKSVYTAAANRGISKSAAFFAGPDSGRTDGSRGLSSRFAKGGTPWNKGTHYTAGGRSAETQFTKGHRPKNWVPIGTERITTKDQYLVRKVSETGTQRQRWRPVHILNWEDINGRVPAGHAIVFKDGDRSNPAFDNLECIGRGDLMKRNTIHNHPKELVDVLQQKGRLTREINKQRRANEEQHRRSA